MSCKRPKITNVRFLEKLRSAQKLLAIRIAMASSKDAEASSCYGPGNRMFVVNWHHPLTCLDDLY